MGLYLCVFDGDNELDGVEVGSYADFNSLRNAVIEVVEGGKFGTRCPVFVGHPDSDGEWTPADATILLKEFDLIEKAFKHAKPIKFNSLWKEKVEKNRGSTMKCLLDCFFDVDGEPLIKRLRQLAELSVQNHIPILFQ